MYYVYIILHVKCSYECNYMYLLGYMQLNTKFKKPYFRNTTLECIKMVITPLVINVFPRNFHHCTQYRQSYLSMLKIGIDENFPKVPFPIEI